MTDTELRDYAIAAHIKSLESARQESITFRLDGHVIAKARPRMNRDTGNVYMPSNYREWKDSAAQKLEGIKRLYPQYTFPLVQANIMYIFDGCHHRKKDGDNMGGSCADALVDAGILTGDSFMVIPDQTMFLNYNKRRSPSTLIVLY